MSTDCYSVISIKFLLRCPNYSRKNAVIKSIRIILGKMYIYLFILQLIKHILFFCFHYLKLIKKISKYLFNSYWY